MPIPFSNTFEGGTDGVALSAANTGGASGDAVAGVSVGAGSTLVFDSAQFAHGGMSMLLTEPAAGVNTYAEWALGSGQGEVWGRAYLRFSSIPNATIRLIRFLSGSTTACAIAIGSAGLLRWYADINGNTAVGSNSTNALSANTWYRIEFHIDFDTSAAVLDAKLFAADNTTEIETLSVTGMNTGGLATADTVRIGNVAGTVSSAYDLWVDDVITNATGYPGPAGGGGGGGGGTFNEASVTFNDADSLFNDFVGATSVPQTGSDSFTLSEALDLQQTRQISVSDSGAFSEARILERQYNVVDSAALSEARALGVSIDLPDSFVLSEASGLVIVENKLGSDAFALSEAGILTTLSLKAGSDSFALSEARALDVQINRTDTFALTEAIALNASLSVTDSAALAEAVALATLDAKSVSDAFALTEATALSMGLTGTDSAALAEAVALSAAVAATDTAALSEARALEAQLARSDTAALTEALQFLSFTAQTGSDSFTFSESIAGGTTFYSTALGLIPVTYWRLGESSGTTAVDAMGSLNGTYEGTHTKGAAGAVPGDTAVTFGGGDVVFAGQATPGAPLYLSTGTVLAWVKTTDTDANYNAIFVKQNAYGLFVKSGNLIAYDYGAAADRSSGVSVTDGAYHLVAFTFDSGVTNGSKLYVDGSLAGSAFTMTVANQGDAVPHIGTDPSAHPFTGDIDEVMVFGRILSAGEISSLYAARSATGGGLTANVSATDAAALAEAVSETASVVAVDLATLTESAIGGQMAQKTGSDSFALSEVAQAIRTAQLSVADSATLSEAFTLAAQINRSDSAALSEAINVVQLVLKTGVDSWALSEDASVIVTVGAPYTHSLPPQFAAGKHEARTILHAAAAAVEGTGGAALVIGAHGARLVLFPAASHLVLLDSEADVEGGYEGDATLS